MTLTFRRSTGPTVIVGLVLLVSSCGSNKDRHKAVESHLAAVSVAPSAGLSEGLIQSGEARVFQSEVLLNTLPLVAGGRSEAVSLTAGSYKIELELIAID